METIRLILGIIFFIIPYLILAYYSFRNFYQLFQKKNNSKEFLTALGRGLLGVCFFIIPLALYFAAMIFILGIDILDTEEGQKLDFILKFCGVLGLLAIAGAILVSFNRLDDENSNKE
jgi:hypothetical protein